MISSNVDASEELTTSASTVSIEALGPIASREGDDIGVVIVSTCEACVVVFMLQFESS